MMHFDFGIRPYSWAKPYESIAALYIKVSCDGAQNTLKPDGRCTGDLLVCYR